MICCHITGVWSHLLVESNIAGIDSTITNNITRTASHNLPKAMDYMPSATAGAVPHLLNVLASLSDTIVKRIAGEQEDISQWESGKKETFFEVINKPIITSFSKILIPTGRQLTG